MVSGKRGMKREQMEGSPPSSSVYRHRGRRERPFTTTDTETGPGTLLFFYKRKGLSTLCLVFPERTGMTGGRRREITDFNVVGRVLLLRCSDSYSTIVMFLPSHLAYLDPVTTA